jgi:hypothetical protein
VRDSGDRRPDTRKRAWGVHVDHDIYAGEYGKKVWS